MATSEANSKIDCNANLKGPWEARIPKRADAREVAATAMKAGAPNLDASTLAHALHRWRWRRRWGHGTTQLEDNYETTMRQL